MITISFRNLKLKDAEIGFEKRQNYHSNTSVKSDSGLRGL